MKATPAGTSGSSSGEPDEHAYLIVMFLGAGERLGPYEILALIGAGGMGEVYRAKDTKLGRQVAIKVLRGDLADDISARERLRREAVAAAALDHPFICKVFEIGEDRGTLFVVMEFITGDTLYQRLRAGSLPLTEALRISGEVAEALEEAHNHQFVHRDLKPANVMLTVGGHAKVMDFGLAKQFASIGWAEAAVTAMVGPTLTETGMAIGTPDYMSPEQVRGEPLDQRSDLFSFGVLLCDLIGSIHPFRRTSTTETLAAILRDPPNLSGDLPHGHDRDIGIFLSLTFSDRRRRRCGMRRRLVDGGTAPSDRNPPDRHGSISRLAANGTRMVRDDAARPEWSRSRG